MLESTNETTTKKPVYTTSTSDFLSEIFQVPAGALNGSSVEIRKFHQTKTQTLTRISHFKNRLSGLSAFVSNQMNEYNVYFGAAARDGRGGEKGNVTAVFALWAECDAKDFDGDKQAARDAINRFPLEPSITVDSGHGWHFYWLLREPFTVSGPVDIEKIEGYLFGICDQIGGDAMVTEIARIMRLPGTWNVKNIENKLQCKIEIFKPTLRYNLVDFDDFFVAKPAAGKKPGTGNNKTLIPAGAAVVAGRCKFIQFCKDNSKTLKYDFWFRMITNLAMFGDGDGVIHDLSKNYPGYSFSETQKMIDNFRAGEHRGHSCKTIQGDFSGCGGCTLENKDKSPFNLISTKRVPGQAAPSETIHSGGAEDQVQAEFPELENLEILGVTETEKVKVYSKDTNTLHEINLSTLKPVGLTQISGKVFDRASFQNAINFIALKARKNQLARFETRSQGISGLPENELIIVSGETAYFFNGKLSEINHPIYKNIEIKFKNGGSWFNPKCVGLNNYKESFCRLLEIVSQWNFESSLSAKLITSMLFATPMQSLFRWRPHVYLTGAAGSAKTLFFQNIFKPLFGNLGLSLEGDNSGAGIRQAINDSFYCVSLDETEGRNENYEKNKAYILEMLKISNRGGKMIRGGKDGVSSTFSLCHSFWLASIEVAITDPANLGRYIVTELKRPGNIVLPTQNELSQIFDSIVSFCLNNYVKILNKIEETRVSYRGDLKDSRLIETYSVPLTILGMLMGESISGNLDKVHESGKTELKPDHEMLLDEIFSSIIPIEYEKATIGSLIERNVLGDMPDKLLNRHLLNFGLKLTESNKKAVIAFHPDTIKQNLLFKSHFKSIKDVLMRHPNATGKRLRFNLRNVEAVTIPIDFLFDLSE